MTIDPYIVDLVRTSHRFKQARSKLAAYRSRGRKAPDEGVARVLKTVKAAAVKANDEALAKAAWCLETILQAQSAYIHAFNDMVEGRLYDAWCALERAEIAISFLDSHYKDDGLFGIEFMRTHIERFQDLFPFGVFSSPEFVYKRVICGICKKRVGLRTTCHRKGEIYAGEMCVHEIQEMEFVALAIVRHPVQKYSVLGPAGADLNSHYNSTTVTYVVRGLRNPWDGWSATKTTALHPHHHFPNAKPDESCPCESGAAYRDCCQSKPGIIRPHFQVTFDEPPPASLPKLQYSNPPAQ